MVPGSFVSTDGTYSRQEFTEQINATHPGVFTSAEDVTTTLAGMGIEVDPALATGIYESSKSEVYTPGSTTVFTEGVRNSTLVSLIFDQGSASAPGQTTPGALGLVANTDGTGAPLRLELDATASNFDRLRFGWTGNATAEDLTSQLQAAGYDPSANQNELNWLANAFGSNGTLSWGDVTTLTQVGALNLGAPNSDALNSGDSATPTTSLVNIDAAIDQALHGSAISITAPAYGDIQSNPAVVDADYELPSASTPYAGDSALAAQLQEQGITIDPAQLSLYRSIQGGAAGESTLSANQLGEAISDGTYEYSVTDDGQLTLQLADPNLRTQDPTVVAALASAGMAPDDIICLAPTVSAEEVAKPGFTTVLSAHLQQGESAIQSLTWARYTGVATTAELSSHQFRTDLNAAAAAGYGDTLENSVHYARSNALVRQLGGATELDTVLALDDATVVALQAKDPAVVQSLLEAGLTLPQVVTTSDANQQALLAEDPVVTHALLGAGMSLADVITQAPSVSVQEAQTPAFTAKLQEKLSAGVPAADAITWARYAGVATDAELSDAQFRADLNAAADAGYGDALADSVHYARSNALVRHTAGAVDLPTALELDDPTLAALQQAAPQDITKFVALGLNLSQFTELSATDRTQLLAADPEVAKALLGAGVSLPAVAQVAGSVSLAEAQNTSFTTVLKQKLAADMPAADAVIWARYTGVATDAELSDAQFRTDLNAAAAAGYGDTLSDGVHYARSNALVRQLDGSVELDAVLALGDTTVQSLLAEDPQTIQPFIDRGLTLEQYLQTTPGQRADLLAADPVVTKALLGAGMSVADVAGNAGSVSVDEANNPTFISTLTQKLAQGLPANEAILWARYTGVATDAELSDPAFINDLADAGLHGWADSPADALHYARANELVRQVNSAIDLPEALALQDATLDSLLAAPPAVVQALLTADLLPTDVAKVAKGVTLAEAQDTNFTTTLKQKLEAGLPTQDAIIWARYQGVATEAELSDAQFRTDLNEAAAHGYGAAPADSVHYARSNALARSLGDAANVEDILALDDQAVVDLLDKDPQEIVQFLDLGLSLEQYVQSTPEQQTALLAADPEVVKALLGAGMSVTDTAANASAVTLLEVQSSKFISTLQAKLAEGLSANDAILWGRYSGWATDAELSDPQFLLDLAAADAQGHGGSLIDRLHYARAELTARNLGIDPTQTLALSMDELTSLSKIDPMQGKGLLALGLSLQQIIQTTEADRTALLSTDPDTVFVIKGLLGAGMTPHDVALYAGTVVTAEEAMYTNGGYFDLVAARLAAGDSAAVAIAGVRYGDVLTQRELGDEAFLHDVLFAPAGTPDHIAYARAMAVVNYLSDGSGNAIQGGDFNSVLALNLNGTQVDQLLTLDADAVRMAMGRGPLDQIVNLTAEALTKINGMDAGYLQWLQSLGTPTLSNIVSLSDTDNASLQASYTAGYRQAAADETFADIVPESVTEPIQLGGWVTTFQTASGQNIIVTQNGNPALFSEVVGNRLLAKALSDGMVTESEFAGVFNAASGGPSSEVLTTIFNFYKNADGVIDNVGYSRLVVDGVLVTNNDTMPKLDFLSFYNVAGLSVGAFVATATNPDGSRPPDITLSQIVGKYDANRDGVFSSDELSLMQKDLVLTGFNANGSANVDSQWFGLIDSAQTGTPDTVLQLTGQPEGSTATITLVDKNGQSHTWSVTDSGTGDYDPYSRSISLSVPVDETLIDPGTPFAVVLSDADGNKLGEYNFIRGSNREYIPLTGYAGSNYSITSKDIVQVEISSSGSGPFSTTAYVFPLSPLLGNSDSYNISSLSDTGELTPYNALTETDFTLGVQKQFLDKLSESDDPELKKFYYAFLAISISPGQFSQYTTLSQTEIDLVDKDAALAYISTFTDGSASQKTENLRALWSGAEADYVAANYTTLSDGVIIHTSEYNNFVNNQNDPNYDNSSTKELPYDVLNPPHPTTLNEYYQGASNGVLDGRYDGATNNDGTPFNVQGTLAYINDPLQAVFGQPQVDLNNDYDLASIAELINNLPPATNPQEIFTIIQKARPTTFLFGNLAKLTEQQRGDIGQFFKAWAADYSKNAELDTKQTLTASIANTTAKLATNQSLSPDRIASINKFLGDIDRVGGFALLAGAFGIVGGALALANPNRTKYQTAAGVQSIVGSFQYTNKYGASIAALADKIFPRALGASNLDHYVSYGSTLSQQTGLNGQTAAANRFLGALPLTIQGAEVAIQNEYVRLADDYERLGTNKTSNVILTEAVQNVRKTYVNRNINVPVQIDKFFQRLETFSRTLTAANTTEETLLFLKQVTGSATTENGFVFTLAQIQSGKGSEIFGAEFAAIGQEDFDKLLVKNNIGLSSEQVTSLKNLLSDVDTLKNERLNNPGNLVRIAELESKVNLSLVDVSQKFNFDRTVNGKLISATEGTLAENLSIFAKALGGAFFVITGVFGAALGVVGIVDGVNTGDPLTIANGAVGTVAGVASVVAGLAAIGLISAAAFPPALIIAGIFGAIQFILSLVNHASSPNLYAASDFYKVLEDYGFAKPGASNQVETVVDAQLDEQFPDNSLYGGS